MNIFLGNDSGEAIWIDASEKVYTRVGPSTSVPPDTVLQPEDVVGITGVTCTYADPQARTVYSAEEYALANNKWYLRTTAIKEVYKEIYASVPVAGVLRFSGESLNCILRLNGILEVPNGGIGNSITVTAALNVAVGDQIEIKQLGGFGADFLNTWIIPFVYP